jgi:hypothetical protein
MGRKPKYTKPNADNTAGTESVKYIFVQNACGVGYAYMAGDIAELSDEAVKFLSEKQIIERV